MLQRLAPHMEAHEMAMDLADRRALQLNAQHPQRNGTGRMGRKKMDMDHTELDPAVDEDVAGNLSGSGKHKSPDARLKSLTGGRKKKVSNKVLEDVGREALKEHKKQHEALHDAEVQGGMLSKHLREKYGDKHAEMFGKGFHGEMKGGFLGALASVAIPLISSLFGRGKMTKDAHDELLGVMKGKGSDFKTMDSAQTAEVMKRVQEGIRKRKEQKGGAVDLITGAVDTGRVANPPPSFARNTVGMGVYGARHRVGAMGGGEYFEGGAKPDSESDSESDEEKGKGGVSGGRKKRAPASASDARRRRGQAVSKLMREKGMTLGEASKYIKEHGY